MFNKNVPEYIKYHILSNNNKIFFRNTKTDHLKHYKEEIMEIQHEVGINNKEILNNPVIKCTEPLSLNIKFSDLMDKRTSNRNFNYYKISLSELSTLLYYSCGYKKINPYQKHTPSSGGFNSVEIFPIILSSNEISKGIYHFDSKKNCLIEIKKGTFSTWIQEDVFFQKEWSKSSAIFVLSSNIGRLFKKYLNRAYRLSLLDIGHVSQNLYLTATALGLNVCAVGGYIDKEIDNSIGIDGIEMASFLTIIVGK